MRDDIVFPTIEDAPTPFVHRGFEVPENLRQSLDRYGKYGVPTGGFLRSVLENDLHGAIARASDDSLVALPAITCYVYNCLPSNSWGSKEIVKSHIDKWYPLSAEILLKGEEEETKNESDT